MNVGQPIGHGHDTTNASVANRGRGAQGVAVKRVKLALKTHLFGGLDQQSQVVAPVAGDHSLRPTGLDLDRIRQEVFDPAHGMQLLAHQSDVGPHQRQLAFGFTGHSVTKTVVLANDVNTLERLVLFNHLHQCGHAHVGMGVKPEVPKTAFLISQDRVNSRIVEKQHALAWLALVVFVDGLDQGRGIG